MEIELIRHFATEGNLEKRYIGVTDEEIKAEFVLEHTLKKEENGREEWNSIGSSPPGNAFVPPESIQL